MNMIEYISASEVIENQKMFLKIIFEAYETTDWICNDYPKHFEHYWAKYVPGIFKNEGQIIVAYYANQIVGLIILRKDGRVAKICTLYVSDKFRRAGIATNLLERAYTWLGTTKPLCTIPNHKLAMFKTIIKKYDWSLTQILEYGYYNKHSKEYVYNGNMNYKTQTN
jgi:GNAT superfamily N-acetyltransferase